MKEQAPQTAEIKPEVDKEQKELLISLRDI